MQAGVGGGEEMNGAHPTRGSISGRPKNFLSVSPKSPVKLLTGLHGTNDSYD